MFETKHQPRVGRFDFSTTSMGSLTNRTRDLSHKYEEMESKKRRGRERERDREPQNEELSISTQENTDHSRPLVGLRQTWSEGDGWRKREIERDPFSSSLLTSVNICN